MKKDLQRKAKKRLQAIAAGGSVNGITSPAFKIPKKLNLLGESLKTQKGRKYGILTKICYLAPAYSGGIKKDGKKVNACPAFTPGCAGGCLGITTPRNRWKSSRNARRWKSALYFSSPELFRAMVILELRALERKAKRLGLVAACRMDGTSDLGLAQGMGLVERFPSIKFYEYTKVESRIIDYAPLDNYHLTYSANEKSNSPRVSRTALRKGLSVAVIVPKGTKPNGLEANALQGKVLGNYRRFVYLQNGDDGDSRFLDSPGSLVYLSQKGGEKARKALGGMVFEV